MSTTFVNIRWWLHKSGQASSLAYAINGLVMTAAFGVSRVFHLPWTTSYFINDFPAIRARTGGAVAWYLAACFLFNMCLQCFWMFLMFKGIIKGVKKMMGGGEKKKD